MQYSRRAVLGGGLALGLGALTGCIPGGGPSDSTDGSDASPAGTTLSLYAYGVAKPAYDAVSAAYANSPQGRDVIVQGSYGASGDQSRKVVAGAPADVVSLSVEPDITRLVDAGLVDPAWKAGPHQGVPFGSVVVLVVRKGNPLGIRDWEDLTRPGLEVVTPNPLSSGSAQWNLLAPYAIKSQGGTDQRAGLEFIDRMVTGHVKTRPGSGPDATEIFRSGGGDVLLSYENEALVAIAKGDDFEYVMPPQTFRVESPVAAVESSPQLELARSFVDFLFTVPAQQALAEAGFRPSDASVLAQYAEKFPTPQRLWSVADLGGWPAVTRELFAKETGAITQIYSKATG